MFDNYSDGYCSQCALTGKQVEMLVNRGDFWECPACNLQAAGGGGSFIILRERGTGNFKSYRVSATEYVVGAFITKESVAIPYESGGWFNDEADFRNFLENDVRPP